MFRHPRSRAQTVRHKSGGDLLAHPPPVVGRWRVAAKASKKQPPAEIPPALRARGAILRKRQRTPLEDAFGQGSGEIIVKLVNWARLQRDHYYKDLSQWRENRRKYAQEAQDVFEHRKSIANGGGTDPNSGPRLIFEMSNNSLNVVAALAEFAAAQAEQDIFGGEPWFAANPVGRNDAALAETIQKHLQWIHRDGRLVSTYSEAITLAACLGEVITKTSYQIETDESEEEIQVLHAGNQPVMLDAENYVTTEAQAQQIKGSLKGKKLSWKPLYRKRSIVLRHGAETRILSHNDVAFREDAEELDLRFTNFYNTIELTVSEAIAQFGLSIEDAIRLAEIARVDQVAKLDDNKPQLTDSPPGAASTKQEDYGNENTEALLNCRIRLLEGFVSVDPFGDGKARRLYMVFPHHQDDWLVYGDYLANISPKAELPIKMHAWEKIPHKCYGRGFFSKYAAVQAHVDDTWNQIGYRNKMHANPVGGWHPEMLDRDDDDADLRIVPNLMLKLKGNHKLSDAIEFIELPDLDQRSMELMQIAIQMVQLRSGITSASQGDMSGLPENNTATGIRQLMSRAAVLLKKPVRWLRRSFGRDFAYSVKLTYANFDRNEAFVWGEGQNAELLELSAEQVRDLDIDVRMLLTQEQNQTKLEGSTAAINAVNSYLGLPEVEKAAVRPIFTQALKALEFEGAEEIIRQPVLTLEDAIALLPPEEQQRVAILLQQQAAAQTPPAGMAAPGTQQAPTPQTP